MSIISCREHSYAVYVEDIELAKPDFSMDPMLMDVLDMTAADAAPYAWMDAVQLALEEVTDRDRYLIESRFYEELTFQQMADRFGFNHRYSAQWALQKALERFKVIFAAQHDIEDPPVEKDTSLAWALNIGGDMTYEEYKAAWDDLTSQEQENVKAKCRHERMGRWARSEERRVGKECRSRWSPYH